MRRHLLVTGAVVLGLSATLSGCTAAGTLTATRKHTTTHNHTTAPVVSVSPSATPTPTPTPTKAKSHSTAAKPSTHKTTTTHSTAPTKHKSPSKPKPKPPAVHYTNGTYSENGSYTSPGGTETIKVTITLGNDIVTAVSVSTVSADPTATGYEAQFAGGISAAAVGKNIGTLHVGAVAGSSLTANGFNQAVGKIRADAKA